MSFIYVDTSVALAQLLAEDRAPREDFWKEPLISSRLIEYEIWTRVHARRLERTHGDAVRTLLGRLALFEMISPVLARASEAFPAPVRTLDALHLATTVFLIDQGQQVQLATYDRTMAKAGRALGIPMFAW